MPSDLLRADLLHEIFAVADSSTAQFRAAQADFSKKLADAYYTAYPPGIAAEAEQEMAATFAGEFGVLWPDCSVVALIDGQPVGAIFVVEESIWDAGLTGPFIIDLFVAAAHQGQRIGIGLIVSAMFACQRKGATTLSLRIGEGTSPAALALYARLGFRTVNERF